MFANIDDSTQTMEAIISYIISGQGDFNKVSDWQGFLDAIKNKCSTENAGKDKETQLRVSPSSSRRSLAKILLSVILLLMIR